MSPQYNDPVASGSVLPLNSLPITAPTIAAAPVEMQPWSDAPMPATAPTGSIAMAPKFDTDKPTVAIVAA